MLKIVVFLYKPMLILPPPPGEMWHPRALKFTNLVKHLKTLPFMNSIWFYHIWVLRRRFLKFHWIWPFWAPPYRPQGGEEHISYKLGSPLPKEPFCEIWWKSVEGFLRRRWKCEKFTHDARRTTDDGRRRTNVDRNRSPFRWPKKVSGSGNPTDPIFIPPTLKHFFQFLVRIF